MGIIGFGKLVICRIKALRLMMLAEDFVSRWKALKALKCQSSHAIFPTLHYTSASSRRRLIVLLVAAAAGVDTVYAPPAICTDQCLSVQNPVWKQTYRLLACPALPDTRRMSLDSDFAAERACVFCVLACLDLLHLLAQRGTVSGMTILASGLDFLLNLPFSPVSPLFARPLNLNGNAGCEIDSMLGIVCLLGDGDACIPCTILAYIGPLAF